MAAEIDSFIGDEIDKAIDIFGRIRADADLLADVVRISDVCTDALRNGGKVIFCGNGGSAADSQHLAAELVGKLQFDRPGLAGLALTVDTSALTAVGNDFGYEFVFSRQLESVGREGDVIIGLSTSGNSVNVHRAFSVAKDMNIFRVGMTGNGPGADNMAAASDICIKIPSTETAKIQEGHILLGHIYCGLVERNIFG